LGELPVAFLAVGEVGVSKDALLLICGDGSVLKVSFTVVVQL